MDRLTLRDITAAYIAGKYGNVAMLKFYRMKSSREIPGLKEAIRKDVTSKMTRHMYDSTTPDDIPADAEVVALYPHAWNADFKRFPHALQVRIDNKGDHADDCHVLDVERYAATPQVAIAWINSWHKLHPSGLAAVNGHFAKPTVYMSEDPLAAFRTLAQGLVYDVWVANWSHGPMAVPGTVGVQYEDSAMTGHSYDLSIITDDTWGAAVPHQGPPPSAITRGRLIPFDSHGTVLWGATAEVHTGDGGHTWAVSGGGLPVPGEFHGGAVVPYAGAGQVQWARSREVASQDGGKTWY